MERLEHYRIPGVQVAVVDGGELRFSKAWGMAEGTLEDGRTLTPDMAMQAASIAKLFAATATLRHLDRSGDADLAALDAGIEALGGDITLRHLLSHTSGLTPGGFAGYGHGDAVPTPEQILAGGAPANHPAVAAAIPAGQEWRYSGGGYQALESWLQVSAGRDFAEVVDDEIFAPLGMSRSGFSAPDPEDLAVGHGKDGQAIADGYRIYPERAAAGLWSTAGDLAAWVVDMQKSQAGKPNRRLRRQTTLTMLEPQEPGGWGLGPILGGEGHATYFGHLGGNAGYRGFVLGFKSSGHGAVVLANGDNGFPLIREIIAGLAVIYNWPAFQPEELEVAALATEELESVVGRYAVTPLPGATLDVSLDGGTLRLRGFGEDVELYALSQNLFADRTQGFEIEVKQRDADGLAEAIEFHTYPAYRFAAVRTTEAGDGESGDG